MTSPSSTTRKWRAPGSNTSSFSSMNTAEQSRSASRSDSSSPIPLIVDSLDNEVAVGLSGPSNSTDNRKAMLQLINRLRDTGVQTDIDLPMIAVIGNQSAGKSSLIESISGITLPRSSGTCTRCPTECKLSYSDSPWKCIVKLHFSTDANGVPVPVRVIPFGDVITSKSFVEDRIRRAQRAILNPSKDPKTYLLQDEFSDDNEASFSKNYVSLEISGSELTDLSFVDLPGLIASVGRGGDDRDIDLVKSLVTSYIEKPSCVILLTVACETDFENQGAHHLARQYDPEGKRTVGVLTKPDRIPQGEEPAWLRILRNETEPLANNWYCVKQPSSQDVAKGISWKEARRQENEWFSSRQPWASLEQQYQRFLRTSYLTERLSLILSELIANRLPDIQEELMSAIQETKTKLYRLPKAPSKDPVSEVLESLKNFTRDLEHRVEGTSDENGLLQTIRPHQVEFKRGIRRTAPNFIPWDNRTCKELPKMAFLSNEEAEDDASSAKESNEIYINQVLKRAHGARTRELPDNYPFVVQQSYIKQITAKWDEPAMKLFDRVYEILKADLAKLVHAHFEHMGNGNAKQAILMIVNDHLDEAADRTKERIQWLLALEQNPATLNTHYYSDYKDKFLGYYKACRDDSRLLEKLNQPDYERSINKITSGFCELGVPAQAKDIPKMLPPDEMEAALNIMASVRAYFQVAYKRFADMVPVAIDYEIVLGVKNDIDKALQEGLQITGPDGYNRCKSMLEERISVSSMRREIHEKMKRLEAARRELRQLM